MGRIIGSNELYDTLMETAGENHGVEYVESNNTIIFKGVRDIQRDDGTYDYYYWDVDDFCNVELTLVTLYDQIRKHKLSLDQLQEALRLLVSIKCK